MPIEVTCFVFYALGLAVGVGVGYSERKRLRAELLTQDALIAENLEQINDYYEHPQKFLDDVALIHAVAGSPIYGDYGRIVDDPKTAISLN